MIKATEFPLSVSFRCPREVVHYAQVHSDFIQSAQHAKPGTVEHVAADDLTFEHGQVVLCRTNAPLIRLALELMTKQVSINVVGRDLEVCLGEGLDEALPAKGTYDNAQVTELIRAYYEPKAQPLKDRIKAGDQGAKRALTELQDLCRCLRFLAWVVSREQGHATLADARRQLSLLCRENLDADVTLSSVHRAKGKEWPHVTILYPELMPLAQGDEEEERAVQFVAITRSQDTLRFAYGKDSWAQQWRVKPAGERQDPAPLSRGSGAQEDFLDEDLPDAPPPLDPRHDLVHWDTLPSLAAPKERTKTSLLPPPARTTLRPPALDTAEVQRPILMPPDVIDALPVPQAAPALVVPEVEWPQVITVASPHPRAITVAAPTAAVQPQPPVKARTTKPSLEGAPTPAQVPPAPVKPAKPRPDATHRVTSTTQVSPVQRSVTQPTPIEPVKPKAATPPSVSAQLQAPPTTPSAPQPSRSCSTSKDTRPFPLLGGPDQLPSPNVKQRLNLLLEEDRSAIRAWAKESLTLIDTLPMGLIPVHLEHLERFERAARVARVAVPNFEPPKPNTAQVCVFDGPIARIRIGKRKGTGGKVLRLAVGSQEMKFDLQTGELSGATDPLSAFVLPEALARLGGSK